MRVYVEAYGCAQNQGEASALARAAQAHRHELVDRPELADVGVLVTCAVIGPTERRMVARWEELASLLPRVVVTGCMVPLRLGSLQGPGRDRTTFLPIRGQDHLPELLNSWGAPESPPGSAAAGPPSAGSARRSLAEEIPIAQGCTSHCTYCFSRLARGRLASVPMERVIARAQEAIRRGAVDVRLTSLDTSAWGIDLAGAPRLPDLIRRVAALDGRFRIRVGMMSPQTLLPIREELFSALSEPRVFRFLHLPVQSGSEPVLHDMRRGYGVGTFTDLVAEGRRALPDLTLSTDVIVGFPGETSSDFEATLAVLRASTPEMVNVTRYSARPGTPAARLPPVPAKVAKERSRSATLLRKELARARLEPWIGRTPLVDWVERGRNGSTVGRLPNYLPVVVGDTVPLGSRGVVRICGATPSYLVGELRATATSPGPGLLPVRA